MCLNNIQTTENPFDPMSDLIKVKICLSKAYLKWCYLFRSFDEIFPWSMNVAITQSYLLGVLHIFIENLKH